MRINYIGQAWKGPLGRLSGEKHGIAIQRDIAVPVGEGIELRLDLYLPEGLDEDIPTLLCWSPYGKEIQAMALERKPIRLGQSLFDQTIEIVDIAFFVSRGYAVVVPSPRGIGNSDGTNKGFLSAQDQEDCCEVIAWLGRQRWCSGKIGMVGTGFSGRIQPLVAARNPEGLSAIMPLDVIDDFYLESYTGGITTDYAFGYAGLLPARDSATEAEDELGEKELRGKLAELRKRPEIRANSYFYRGLDSWPLCHYNWNADVLIHNEPGPFWSSRSMAGKWKTLRVPCYFVSLYYEFGRSTASALNAFNEASCSVAKKAMLIESALTRRAPYDEANFEMLRWYDHWLKGIDTAILDEPPIKLCILGEDRFRYETEWPLGRTAYTDLYLEASGKLTFVDPAASEASPDDAATLLHEPPTLVSQAAHEIPSLDYRCGPFEKDIEITGPLSARIYSETDAEDANLCALFWELFPDGTKTLFSTGYLKMRHSGNDARSPGSAAPHDDTGQSVAAVPGKVNEYAIELCPIARVVKAGHSLMLQIKAMDYAVFNPNERRSFPLLFPSGRVVGPQPGTSFVKYKIHFGKRYPSRIVLPLIKSSPAESWIDPDCGYIKAARQ